MEMPVFTIRGKNHRERGVDYGVQCKELIQGVLERYIRFFNGGHTAVSWDEAKVISKEFLPFIHSYSPELLDELEGIAQGADVEFDDLLTLNSRSEAMTLVRRPPSDKGDWMAVPALQYCRMLLLMDIRSWHRTGTLTHGRNMAP